jgi:hypothetical protein
MASALVAWSSTVEAVSVEVVGAAQRRSGRRGTGVDVVDATSRRTWRRSSR